MSVSAETLLKFLVAGAPIAISGAVGLIAFFQWRLARQKLRLDLYNRRYAIYESLLTFYPILIGWKGEPEQKAVYDRFFRASKEAKFLFSHKSGIPALFDEMMDDAAYAIGFTDNVESIRTDRNLLMEMHAKTTEIHVTKFDRHFKTLTAAITPFIRFHAV